MFKVNKKVPDYIVTYAQSYRLRQWIEGIDTRFSLILL